MDDVMKNSNEWADAALISTFLADSQFHQKLKDTAFLKHVISQKMVIRSLLESSFDLRTTIAQSGNAAAPAAAPTMVMPVAAPAVMASAAASVVSSPSVYKPERHDKAAPVTLIKAEAPVSPTPLSVAVSPAGLPSDIFDQIKSIFVEKTGYPEDMLDPHLDLEADLGIDTVKQMEIHGLIRQKFGLTMEEKAALKDTPTLKSVADMVQRRLQKAS